MTNPPETPSRARFARPAILVLSAAAIILAGSFALYKIGHRRSSETPATQTAAPHPKHHKHPEPLKAALEVLAQQPSFSIVQLGAYVGDSPNDPLCAFLRQQLHPARTGGSAHAAQVVLVEPIREYFDQLRANYAGFSGVQFANVAIAESDGVRDFYTLKVDPTKYGYPEWLAQLSSLKRERMGKLWDEYEKNPEYKKFYLEHRAVEKVKCITLSHLLRQYQIEKLDLLQLDVEGYEYEILKTLDFKTVKPRFINYERVLLQEDEPRLRELLTQQGYTLTDWGQDTFCSL
jgi:FkbM family methyltransferase